MSISCLYVVQFLSTTSQDENPMHKVVPYFHISRTPVGRITIVIYSRFLPCMDVHYAMQCPKLLAMTIRVKEEK